VEVRAGVKIEGILFGLAPLSYSYLRPSKMGIEE